MPSSLTWTDLAVRLICTFIAGALVGINRGERGRPAGLRTTLLVCLAASFSMLLANALLQTTGKDQSYFTQMDVMRLPLGVLTGMGFIGAGAILRKGSVVVGITTAATLWYVTVMGFCFGAGQLVLGWYALGIALLVLWVLKHVENWGRVERRGSLELAIAEDGPGEDALRSVLAKHKFQVTASGLAVSELPRKTTYHYEVEWRARRSETEHPAFIAELLESPAVINIDWKPQALDEQ
ncbi:MAG: MgtC/SapB family protein [Acidobacteriaceae bacterium]|nr:MgtC/SapB family protein [Acidobacteriaceae bacterium]